MEIIGLFFDTLFFAPIVNLLVFIFKLLEGFGIFGALGWAIILLTAVVKLLIWPITSSQIKSTQKMAELKPYLDELKKKHSDDKQALHLAQMALYKEHRVNPASGCLPVLLQIPIFLALYQAILNVFPTPSGGNLETINRLLYHPWLYLNNAPDPNFLGLSLAVKPGDFFKEGPIPLLVPVVTLALTFIQSKMMMPQKITHHPDESAKETKGKEGIEEAMASIQGQMVYLMPLMVGVIAFQFPVGLAIYWNTYTLLGIIQQYLVSGWGGMGSLMNKFGIKAHPKTKVKIERQG